MAAVFDGAGIAGAVPVVAGALVADTPGPFVVVSVVVPFFFLEKRDLILSSGDSIRLRVSRSA